MLGGLLFLLTIKTSDENKDFLTQKLDNSLAIGYNNLSIN